MKRAFVVMVSVALQTIALANLNPASLAIDERIRVVPYQANNVVSVAGSTFVSTQIVFGTHEHIVDVQGGDADAWTINVDKYLPNILNLKPTILNSNSNMTVATVSESGEQRIYYFHLTAIDPTVKDAEKPTYAIHFVYPDETRIQAVAKLRDEHVQKSAILNAAQHPKDYNWNYSFNGDKTLIPLHVFDDGKFTYLELRNQQIVPAVFAVHKANGDEAVVNYRRAGEYIVIQQVAPQFTLRNGTDMVASIFNNKLIDKLAANERE